MTPPTPPTPRKRRGSGGIPSWRRGVVAVRKALQRAAGLAVLGATAAASAGSVHFPDTDGIFVPADRPGEIILSSNVGLVRSDDGGRTWAWSCAQQGFDAGPGYVLGAAPLHRLFAPGAPLTYSDDGGCSWQAA